MSFSFQPCVQSSIKSNETIHPKDSQEESPSYLSEKLMHEISSICSAETTTQTLRLIKPLVGLLTIIQNQKLSGTSVQLPTKSTVELSTPIDLSSSSSITHSRSPFMPSLKPTKILSPRETLFIKGKYDFMADLFVKTHNELINNQLQSSSVKSIEISTESLEKPDQSPISIDSAFYTNSRSPSNSSKITLSESTSSINGYDDPLEHQYNVLITPDSYETVIKDKSTNVSKLFYCNLVKDGKIIRETDLNELGIETPVTISYRPNEKKLRVKSIKFSCGYCYKTFSFYQTLRDHIMKFHWDSGEKIFYRIY